MPKRKRKIKQEEEKGGGGSRPKKRQKINNPIRKYRQRVKRTKKDKEEEFNYKTKHVLQLTKRCDSSIKKIKKMELAFSKNDQITFTKKSAKNVLNDLRIMKETLLKLKHYTKDTDKKLATMKINDSLQKRVISKLSEYFCTEKEKTEFLSLTLSQTGINLLNIPQIK